MKLDYMIIEDEFLSSERLRVMIAELRPSYNFVCQTETVDESVEYLKFNKVDLIFVDIELADYSCFEIFSRIKVDTPVIFTTAYNEYAIRAFKVNSIDYLLKPLEKNELMTAIEKFESVRIPAGDVLNYDKLKNMISGYDTKERILISRGDNFLYVDIAETTHFSSEEKYTYLHTFSGHSHITDHSLNQLEAMLDRKSFFRVSRNHIVNIKAVKEVRKYFNGRLRLRLCSSPAVEIIISSARREGFLKWLGGEIE